MKKILLFMLLITTSISLSIGSIFAGSSVNIYATVGETNNIPRISEIIPDYNPTIVYIGEGLIFQFSVSDKENELLYYTISTDDGIIDNTSGTINGSGNISFLYQGPSYFPQAGTPSEGLTKIYITVNDGINFIVKEINVYIF
ncbi:MAG: hypothetical protein V3575_04905 [Candidatus Absconditabacteria bacterium]